MKERLDYITNLRFPLILGVVLDHASVRIPDSLRGGEDTASMIFSMLQIILKISVPVFFIISGFLFFRGVTAFDNKQYVAKLRSRVHTLLIPYILWTLICLIFLILEQCPTILHTHSLDSIRDLFTWQIFWMYKQGLPLHFSLWYVRDLIIMSLCSPLVWILMSKLRHIGMLIIFALYMFVNIDPSISFPISVFYFSLGCYFAICHIDICYIAGRLRWSIVPIMVLMLFSVLIDNVMLIRMAHIVFAAGYLLLGAFLTSQYRFTVPQRLTDSVFFVYAMHTIAIMMILNKIFIRLIPDSSMAVLLFARLFIVGILTTVICVALYHLLKRFLPKTISVLCGSRIRLIYISFLLVSATLLQMTSCQRPEEVLDNLDKKDTTATTHYPITPTSIVMLSTKPVELSYGTRDTIEFRINPSNAIINISGDSCQIELDKVAAFAPARSSYVTVPNYYELIAIEQVYNDSTQEPKVGQYRAIIEDTKLSAEYDEMAALVLNIVDANGDDIQISSSAFEILGRNYDFMLPKTGLPVLIINTPQAAPIVSKEEYIAGADFTLLHPDLTYDYQGETKIKGRGNTTWRAYPKKPYAVKLEEKQSLFGFPQSKKWTLLADFCDKSMLRTAFMIEMSKACGLKYTVNYQHVEVVLNGQYEGTYILTEKVEKDKNRVNIQSDGFIIENDGYAQFEPLWFKTTYGKLTYTFKYPDPDGDIAEGDNNYNYISTFMNNLETALYSPDYMDETNGYRQYIDSKSFAKWYILMELLGNLDPNWFYVLEKRGAKLEMFPAWDAEWSLGLGWLEDGSWMTGKGEPMPYDKQVHGIYGYLARLKNDPAFQADIKDEWNNIKPQIPAALATLQTLRNSLRLAQAENFTRWPILGTYQSVEAFSFSTWEEEADFVFDYFNRRYQWFDTYIENL